MDLPADLGPVVLFVQGFVRKPLVQVGEDPEQESAYGRKPCKSALRKQIKKFSRTVVFGFVLAA
jgi:hypothetical protein